MVEEDIYNLIVQQIGTDNIIIVQQIGTDNINKISSVLGLPIQSTIVIIAIFLLVIFIWSLIWKGLALWKSVKKDHKWWFILILVLNTVGILEILYIYLFSKINWNKKQLRRKNK